jgi:tRNA A37 threonylcarbamoyladenosine synthetase subunit TsaC/SUA5/YrdC
MWKRREVGIRWPHEPYCQAAMDALGGVALLASSVPDIESDENILAGDPGKILKQWERQVDFIVSAGNLSAEMKSTVVDVMRGWQVLREGLGMEEFRAVLALEYGADFVSHLDIESASRNGSAD